MTLEISGDEESVAGVDVVSHLKKELAADAELLGVPVLSVQTLICQNNCSGHGYCDQVTNHSSVVFLHA